MGRLRLIDAGTLGRAGTTATRRCSRVIKPHQTKRRHAECCSAVIRENPAMA
jgi:hypothetical protein